MARCVYCGSEEARLWNITHKIRSKIILKEKRFISHYLCTICYFDGKHLPDMGIRWLRIIFYELTEDELKALPKHILSHLRKERDIELEHQRKGLDYEVKMIDG